LELTFTSAKSSAELPLRACGCTFCRRHGMRATSDPQGRVVFKVNDETALQKYRFGQKTASFLICRVCGTFMAAVSSDSAGDIAVVNVNCFIDQKPFDRASQVTDFDAETGDTREARRRQTWTPAAWA
jgi:hypothetical protein